MESVDWFNADTTNSHYNSMDSANAMNAATNAQNAATNAKNAETNRMNAETNASNAEVNAQNADTNSFNSVVNAADKFYGNLVDTVRTGAEAFKDVTQGARNFSSLIAQ
nr:putative ORF1 [Marmot picobirnavirus]